MYCMGKFNKLFRSVNHTNICNGHKPPLKTKSSGTNACDTPINARVACVETPAEHQKKMKKHMRNYIDSKPWFFTQIGKETLRKFQVYRCHISIYLESQFVPRNNGYKYLVFIGSCHVSFSKVLEVGSRYFLLVQLVVYNT